MIALTMLTCLDICVSHSLRKRFIIFVKFNEKKLKLKMKADEGLRV